MIERLVDDPEAVWPEFARQYASLIEGCVRACGIPSSCLEDFVQEVYFELLRNDFRRLRQYDPERGSPSTFLRVVASRIIVDLLRKRQNEPNYRTVFSDRQEDGMPWLNIVEDNLSPREAAAENELLQMLEQEVRALVGEGKAKPIDLLILRYKSAGFQTQEIAEALDMKENALDVRFHRLKKHLQRRVKWT